MNNQPHATHWFRGRKRRVAKALLASLAIGSAITLSGCSMSSYCREVFSPYEEMGGCMMTDLRARTKAKSMWRSKYAHCYGTVVTAPDVRRGFIDGFAETAGGGTGNAPLVPPENYCGLARKVEAEAWFKGYTLGAAAAESCGASQWRRSTVSPALAACFATPQCTPGCVPCPPMCGCNKSNCNGNCGISAPAPELPITPMATEYQSYDGDTINDDAPPEPPMSIQEPLRSEPSAEELRKESTPDPIDEPKLRRDPLDLDPSDDAAPVKSPSDIELPNPLERPNKSPTKPSDAIERAIDDATSALPVRSKSSATAMSPYKLPSHRVSIRDEGMLEGSASISLSDKLMSSTYKPPVGGVIEAPRFDERTFVPSQKPEVKSAMGNSKVAKKTDEPRTIKTESLPIPTQPKHEQGPVIKGPVEMPNIQVSYDWQAPDWLFGEVDVTRALLERELPSDSGSDQE